MNLEHTELKAFLLDYRFGINEDKDESKVYGTLANIAKFNSYSPTFLASWLVNELRRTKSLK